MSVIAPLIGVCLSLAAAPQVPPRFVPTHAFTLAWTHSIEKERWEEDYQVLPSATAGGQPTMVAGKARIHGSGAGMEPPADAVFHDGWFEYQPERHLPPALRLTRSIYTADFDFCVAGLCQTMSAVMPTDGDITLLYPCSDPTHKP